MKPGETTSRKNQYKRERSGPLGQVLLSFILVFAFFMPYIALASVNATEIMYDVDGSDTGREWVEITTDTPVNFFGYKFFEGGTNHTLTVVQGTSTLTAGEVAVIVSNIEKFKIDFPSYSGTVFKSSFSLSNDGEELIIKDSKLQPVASVTYTASGAAAGNSLHLSGSSWVAGAPNPGSLALTKEIVKAVPVKKTSTKAKSSSKNVFGSESNLQSAAVAETSSHLPAFAGGSTWTTLLGLVALIIVGVAGVLFIKQPKDTSLETNLTADEFKLE